ncbi:kinase-like protein [Artomyces pyxidatus]|uniref:Kinase-like protein n=1 Tax=Artomyces pyxidatus TaxID=48021 RepID=A0ACB8T8Y0_9AGAM|nr:kinase-like protein [Artomyces pyxidatus]
MPADRSKPNGGPSGAPSEPSRKAARNHVPFGTRIAMAHGKQSRVRKRRLDELEVVKTLGAGSAARVMLVRTTAREDSRPLEKPGALFAMKVFKKRALRRELMYWEEHAERARLSETPWHPFIAGLLDVFADEKNVYEMLEFLPCGNLRVHLQRIGGRMDGPTATFYYANIVLGLQFLHGLGIIHRDLKPDNIILGGNGYLAITDFGHAKLDSASKDDSEWQALGTPYYMAPEIVTTGMPARYRTFGVDWWASGVILYELVTGEFPFDNYDEDGPNDETVVEELFEQIRYADVPWPAEIPLGRQLQSIIERLLRKEPERRLHGDNGTLVKHPWLANVDWVRMGRQLYKAPYVPQAHRHETNWHTWRMPTEDEIPGLPITDVPVMQQFDDRFFESED